jgi:hypothetical protein
MPFDKFMNIEAVQEQRRDAVHQSVREITPEELKKLTKENLSDFEGDPWQANFLRMIEEHPQGSFYHAVTREGAIVLYSSDEDAGVWVLPGSGMGPLPDEAKGDVRAAIGLPNSGRTSPANPSQSLPESRNSKSRGNKP